MPEPRFSVVVPTRERPDTLRHALRTCTEQDFDDYEVIVCDNFSSPATREVVEAVGSPRVRYVRTDRPLAMSANWELAVGQARGEYVTVLGDDDGLMPFALREADHLIRTRGAAIVHWTRGLYTWPNLATPDDANFLRVPLTRPVRECSSPERLAAVAAFRAGPEVLPMIYCSFVRHDVLDCHRRHAGGRLFLSAYPDIYSAFGLGIVSGRYLSIGVPLSVAGLSGHSNGMATLLVDVRNPIATEFVELSRADGYASHPTVPPLPIWPVPTADAFQHARDVLCPHEANLALDRKLFTEVCLHALPMTDPAERARARQMIRDALADRPDLTAWFDVEAPDPPPFRPALLHGFTPGFDGAALNLDVTPFGVRDVYAATRLAADLLRVRPGEVAYTEAA